MKQDGSQLISIGDFAKKAGTTLRTLRYYDNIGLLKPSKYNQKGQRFYDKHDFAKLQKILTLKFIGFSLDEIKKISVFDVNEEDFKKSLEIQKEIVDRKIQHTKMVMRAIDDTLEMLNKNEEINWENFANIINVLNMDNKLLAQYQNASNLRARIRIHDELSANKYGWMRWYFDRLLNISNIPKNLKILELGCGDASLWFKNMDRIPKEWDITLTDFSKGMLYDAKMNLKEKASRFKFKIVDVQDIPFENETFHVVIANHMLYHVDDIDRALSEIHRVLNKNGYFYASTVGKNHMVEMRNLMFQFGSKDINSKSWDNTSKFQLENGKDVMEKWFKDINIERYEDSLNITKAEPLIDYIFSMPGNVREQFDEDKIQELREFLNKKIKEENGIHISKDTGLFTARKQEFY
ncbi:MerR family transcriptional regulator [Haloimpatiens lingqiaonensis]|uniref:MerR family transcriptional regulator n=1 Tax=Haloimpatiens lingqiaonensis TaxID=1380675 RepID=UPI0010FE3836|nr:methyltransferase domain-containing protein [Haloimpatiens lingqiaonensis]